MDWIKRLNSAIGYIEEHLAEEIEIEQVAKLAACSAYHFQRMFAYMAEVPLSEYIRRRRMARAAVDLQQDEAKVIDIALKYGYDSPTAFNRAFQSVHGMSPTQARAEGVLLKAYPPISFKITIKGAAEMNYRIEKKESFRIVGYSAPMSQNMEENFDVIPKMWQKVAMEGEIEKLCGLMNSEPKGILGVCGCQNVDDSWSYYISVATTAPTPASMDECVIPAATWAIFPGEGTMPQAIQELEKRVMQEWLPTSGYEYGNSPDIEVYFDANPQNSKFEVWMPVVKKVE
ncbi:MAG: AraC family transcriptional regulator [Angelakisella sp.]